MHRVGAYISYCEHDLARQNMILTTDLIYSYNMLKKRAAGDDPNFYLSPGAYLLCSAQASSQTSPSVLFLVLIKVNSRRSDGNDDESNMGGQSAHVHHTSRFTDCISKLMG